MYFAITVQPPPLINFKNPYIKRIIAGEKIKVPIHATPTSTVISVKKKPIFDIKYIPEAETPVSQSIRPLPEGSGAIGGVGGVKFPIFPPKYFDAPRPKIKTIKKRNIAYS